MSPAKTISSFVLPLLVWLVYGAPNLSLAGNLALLGIITLHLYLLIWSDLVWSCFSGDRFTYRMVGMGFGSFSFAVTFSLGAYLIYSAHKSLEYVSSIPAPSWAIFVLGIFATLLIPMLSTKRVTPLPKISERGEFENPTNRL